MENDTIPTFPKEWNEKMGISKEDFAFLQKNLGLAYKMNVIVKNNINADRYDYNFEAYEAETNLGIYGNTARLIEQKKNILKDVTPEQVLLAYTKLTMVEMEKFNSGKLSASESLSYLGLVETGRCLLSGELPTNEVAAKVGNMMLSYKPDAVQKKLEELKEQTISSPRINVVGKDCGKATSVFTKGRAILRKSCNDGPDI